MLYFLVQMFPTIDASEEDGKTNKQNQQEFLTACK